MAFSGVKNEFLSLIHSRHKGLETKKLTFILYFQVLRECLEKNADNPSEVIYTHDDLYVSGTAGIEDKLWS